MRDPVELVDEMEWLIKEYKANDFEFFDLTAIIKKDWIIEFCNELKKRELNDITWQLPVGTRSEALDEEVLKIIYETGCRFVCYAPESGSTKSLKMIKKRVKLDRLIKSVKSSVKIGHTTKLNFIIGFPHETLLDCLKTISFALYCALRFGISDILFSTFTPYPGSELFDQLHKNGQISNLDDKYFYNLSSNSDIFNSHSFSKHVNTAMLAFYRLGGMSMFYIISFLLHPKRLFRLFSNVINKREESKLDMALIQMIDRFKRNKKTPSSRSH